MTNPQSCSIALHDIIASYEQKAVDKAAYLDMISNDIELLEKQLRSHIITKSFSLEVDPGEYLQWNIVSKRLCYKSPGCCRPLIETKVSVRERMHSKLIDFYKSLMKKVYEETRGNT